MSEMVQKQIMIFLNELISLNLPKEEFEAKFRLIKRNLEHHINHEPLKPGADVPDNLECTHTLWL